ncbi:MAG: hypothetical protein HYV28_16905 [Ignavibacteriales bacterium]|nr:hypothetical protein [Ignavibacteriales bacterium]
MNKIFSLLLVCTFLQSQTLTNSASPDKKNSGGSSISKLSWLIGKWQNRSENSVMYEFWEKANDSVYNGRSFVIAGGDTVFFESIYLKQIGNDLLYIPSVSNQNDGKPVVFTLTSKTDSCSVFENPKHDFPQRIVYCFGTNNSLLAYIEGVVNGKHKREDFPFTRMHKNDE